MSLVDGELTSIALCWSLERKDGAGLALTTHDQSLASNDIRYEPAPGATPAAIRSALGLEPSSSEMTGSLTSAAISQADVAAGRWDGASIRLIALDWQSQESSELELLSGELGQIVDRDGAFEAEVLGASAKLERPVCPLTSPECRAELGDPDCRVDMAGRRIRATVTAVAGHVLTLDRVVDERFRFGKIRFLAGAANGERQNILVAGGTQVTLLGPTAGTVAVGTPVELSEGCDKSIATCSARFGNAVNFRGEPHLPGNDLLTRYPGI